MATTPFAPVRFAHRDAMLLGGLRRRHRFADAPAGTARQWSDFLNGEMPPGRIGGDRLGVMCGADAAGLEYMCAVPVASLDPLPEGVGRMRVPAQRYAVFQHDGPAATLPTTWQRILDWLEGGDYASAHTPDFELYGEGCDPRTAPAGVEIWVGVVPRESRPPRDEALAPSAERGRP